MTSSNSRTIFIGDVHGCLDELKSLINKLQFTTTDRIILLGDLVNKGPYSIETIRFVYQHQIESLMGNNDWYFLKHHYSLLKKNLNNKEIEWFSTLPLYIKEDRFIAVHAGLHPNYSLENTPKKILLTIRKWKSQPWYHHYKGKLPVIYGHWAQQGLNIKPNLTEPLTIGLDSGCVYGKKLTAYIWETKQIVQVNAQKIYLAIL